MRLAITTAVAPTWAKIFDGDTGSAPTWYGTQYAGNPQVVEFDLRDFTGDGVTSVEIWDIYTSPNPRPFQVYLLDSSRTKITGSDWVYDAALGGPNGGFQNVPVPAGSSPAYIKFDCNNAWAIISLAGIRVNGTFLAQNANPNPDYDLMADSPTQNYATLNPLQVVENKNTPLSNANLTAQNNTSAQIKTATIEIPAGKWYWEHTTTQSTEPSYPLLGISKTNVPSVFGGRDSQLTSIFYGATGNLFEFTNSSTGTSYGDSYGVGDVIGTAYDANTGELEFFKNGVSQGVAATVSADFRLAMMPSGSYGYNSNNTVSVNFGQQPFLYTPPTGFEKLQTQNLPAAKIVDGREHFQAITGSGNADGVVWQEGTITNANPTDPLNLTTELGPWTNNSLYNQADTLSYTLVLTEAQNTLTWRLQAGYDSGAICYVSEDGITWRNYNPGNLYPPATATPGLQILISLLMMERRLNTCVSWDPAQH